MIDIILINLYPKYRSDIMNKTDTVLISKVQKGDEEAFNQLFQELYQTVYYTAYRICKSDDEAKEITQQTFIQVHKSIKNLQEIKTFDVWLHRIVVNKCYNLFAKHKDMVIDPNTSAMMKTEKEYRSYLLPTETTRHNSDVEVLNHFIDELPEKYRILLVLSYFHEHSLEEVALILDLPIGTVKSRLFAARNLLKKKITEYEKREGISLNFHDISSSILISAFLASFQKMNIIIPLTIPKSYTGLSHLLASTLLQNVAIGLLGTVIGISTFGAYTSWKQTQDVLNQITKENTNNDTKLRYLDNEIIFQPLIINGTAIDTPQEAYYSLLKWAHCEVELHEMSKEELAQYEPLYEALKSTKSTYFLELEKLGWIEEYEQLK